MNTHIHDLRSFTKLDIGTSINKSGWVKLVNNNNNNLNTIENEFTNNVRLLGRHKTKREDGFSRHIYLFIAHIQLKITTFPLLLYIYIVIDFLALDTFLLLLDFITL